MVVILFIASFSCVYIRGPSEKQEGIFGPVEASLCHINQKVASHFLVSGVPDSFNEAQYKTAVEEVCYSSPACKSQAQAIFNSYGVNARKIDDIFSVMLCDKEMKWKVMEDFSCNNLRVEIHSWKTTEKVPCEFEGNWQRIRQENCNE